MHASLLNHLNTDQAYALFASVWSSSNFHHQICSYDRANNKFINIPVSSITEATRRTLKISNQGNEAYFACAEFTTTNNREASNAAGASCLFSDIDCGPEKASSGKGYETVTAAVNALKQFCQDAEMPYVTHIVFSGGGVHVYWALDCSVNRKTWQDIAKKLKALAKALGFFVDPSRTSDIASVLRVPGTFNYKYSPPRPVTLEYASEAPVSHLALFAAIDAAYNKFCGGPVISKQSNVVKVVNVVNVDFTGARYQKLESPNLESLASALVALDPDCDERTWTIYRLAPMARVARDNTGFRASLYDLAKSWSSGELQGKQSKAWFVCLGNGKCGRDVFDTVWNRFLNEKPSDQLLTTFGSIYRDAKVAGWSGWAEDTFQVVVNEGAK